MCVFPRAHRCAIGHLQSARRGFAAQAVSPWNPVQKNPLCPKGDEDLISAGTAAVLSVGPLQSRSLLMILRSHSLMILRSYLPYDNRSITFIVIVICDIHHLYLWVILVL
jgi:hypothetical protein